ncbi:hypothetical protein, partial [Candidatus Magnetaquicoccus inordinatus]|uniref:hypothetical protein n=1 Tax=Candidatus Magnetaquicoccus inordinatus TaxID=2496818 RepID=UPI001D0F065C
YLRWLAIVSGLPERGNCYIPSEATQNSNRLMKSIACSRVVAIVWSTKAEQANLHGIYRQKNPLPESVTPARGSDQTKRTVVTII